jgi:UDP-2,3-diacylglucosamine hydrolase
MQKPTTAMTSTARGTAVSITAKTAVIAGSGTLPEVLAQELVARGQAPVIAAIAGEAGAWIGDHPHFKIQTVEIGRLVKELKARNVVNVVMAGGVRSRPELSSIRPDWVTLRSIPVFLRALRRGDDGLLRAFMRVMENQGFKVLGAHEIMPDLLAQLGTMTGAVPDRGDHEDMARAFEAARELGRLDIGQGAVAVRGRVVAVEGAEGTQAMLARVCELRETGRISRKHGGVLVKIAKPGQEKRADLPAIGPDTIDQAANAGLAGIAVEADASLILDFAETIRRANLRKIFVHGVRGV